MLREYTLKPLKVSYDAAEAEKESLRAEVEQFKMDYEALVDKLTLDVSWAYLCTRLETLTEASQEDFNLKAKLSKAKEAVETTQHRQKFSTPQNENFKGDLSKEDAEADPQPSTLCPPADPSFAENLPP